MQYVFQLLARVGGCTSVRLCVVSGRWLSTGGVDDECVSEVISLTMCHGVAVVEHSRGCVGWRRGDGVCQ